MLVANSESKKRLYAWLTEKSQGPFFCPACEVEVILKKGRVREHHFAHKPHVKCAYGIGETQKHYKVKREIFEALSTHPKCSKCELERPLAWVRPDISLYIDKNPIAIEVQKTTIDIDEIIKRSKRYSLLGIYLLWILPDGKPQNIKYLNNEDKFICRLKEWQKFLHAMYFGRLYFWTKEAIVCPIHLSKYKYYVEQGNWVDNFYDSIGDSLEGTYWHDEHYDDAYYGGCWKESKSKMEIIPPPQIEHQSLQIAEHFKAITRNEWKAKNWIVPKSRIWMDYLQNWW